jgi:hypothetical protein
VKHGERKRERWASVRSRRFDSLSFEMKNGRSSINYHDRSRECEQGLLIFRVKRENKKKKKKKKNFFFFLSLDTPVTKNGPNASETKANSGRLAIGNIVISTNNSSAKIVKCDNSTGESVIDSNAIAIDIISNINNIIINNNIESIGTS